MNPFKEVVTLKLCTLDIEKHRPTNNPRVHFECAMLEVKLRLITNALLSRIIYKTRQVY